MRAIDWGGKSATDPQFLNVVKEWIENDGEVYLMLWFHAAGGTQHHWLPNSFDHFISILNSVHGHCSADVYRHPHFPIRGIVNDDFIQQALAGFPDGEDWFLMAFEQENDPRITSAEGDKSHVALVEKLRRHVGKFVVIGPDMHWPVPPNDYPGEWVSGVLNIPFRYGAK